MHPALTGRGFGSALVDLVIHRTKEEGRSTIIARARMPFERREDHPYRRFAERRGFTLANTEVHRVLDLPVDEQLLASMIRGGGAAPPGYTIERYVGGRAGGAAAVLLPRHNQLVLDAPPATSSSRRRRSPRRSGWSARTQLRAARRLRSTVRGAGRRPAGRRLQRPVDPAGRPARTSTSGARSCVRDHRGHRLGLALKARNLLEVQREHPGRTALHTANAEVNASHGRDQRAPGVPAGRDLPGVPAQALRPPVRVVSVALVWLNHVAGLAVFGCG